MCYNLMQDISQGICYAIQIQTLSYILLLIKKILIILIVLLYY